MRPFLLALFFLLAALGFAQTPEATVQQFADAISKRDMEGAAKLVAGGRAPAELVMAAKSEMQWPSLALSNLTSKVEGNSATVSYDIVVTGMGKDGKRAEQISLVSQNGAWLIQSRDTEPRNESVIPMLAYMFTHPQVFQLAKSAAKAAACLSNLKQIALACIMYSSDMDDVFKFTATNWTTKISPYTKNKTIFTCPDDPKGTVSYSLNPKMVNKNSSKVKDPANTVLLYEGKNGKLNFRHDGKAAVSFVDGHARRVTAQQAKSLDWNP